MISVLVEAWQCAYELVSDQTFSRKFFTSLSGSAKKDQHLAKAVVGSDRGKKKEGYTGTLIVTKLVT